MLECSYSVVAVFIALSTMVWTGHQITARAVFTTYLLIYVLQKSNIELFLMGVHYGGQCLVTSKRLNSFLLSDEEDMCADKSGKSEEDHSDTVENQTIGCPQAKPLLSLTEATCYPSDNPDIPLLNKVSFSVRSNQLLAITGPTGSGKSSILYAITKELQITRGSISHIGRIVHVTQSPWMFSGTIRDNILFGEPFREKRYQNVIRACALKQDFETLPNGDYTQIGERGVSLSGGQRARVNLARAVYCDADIFLLDDPLCNLDNKVGEQIFQMCICGFLKEQLRVLVTHHPSFLERADCVVIVQNGQVDATGKYTDLLSSSEYLRKHSQNVKEKEQKRLPSLGLISPGKCIFHKIKLASPFSAIKHSHD